MAGTTTNYNFPYPENNDQVNVAEDIENLAVDVDSQLASSLLLKANVASPTFTGTVSLPSTTSIGDISSTEIGYLDNVSSNIQTQINTKIPANTLTPTNIPVEILTDITHTSNAIECNLSTSSLFYLTNTPTANLTLSAINVPAINGTATNISIIIPQGATGYIFNNSVNINGSSNTMSWINNTSPVPNANFKDIFSFTFLRRSSAWLVFGSMSGRF